MKKSRSTYLLEKLEPRLLFSADLALLPLDGGTPAADQDILLNMPLRAESSASQQHESFEQIGREVVFIDSGVADYQILLNDIQLQRESGRRVDTVILDSAQDGIAQISTYLDSQQNISAIHIISHGSDGEVVLGDSPLNSTTLGSYAESIEGWQQSLTDQADLLFYGCNLASGEAGQALISSLSLLTNADVAASDDITGQAALGGDWDLEQSVGEIETGVVVSGKVQQSWVGTLDTLTVSTTADVLDGDADTSSPANLVMNPGSDSFISLREAIIAANNTPGADKIVLPAGTYTLSRTGTGEDDGVSGDLDIRNSGLTIRGAGADITIIDANSIDRVFHILSGAGNIVIDGVTISNGHSDSDSGTGLYIMDGNDVTITDSEITNNSTTFGLGGGIYNLESTLSLTGVTLSGNSASEGGGIRDDNALGDTLTNVTLSGNAATNQGGGIRTSGNLTLVNTTIANNTADSGAGIYDQSDGSTVDLHNTILSNNTGGNANHALTSSGHNIDSDGTAELSGAGDQSGTEGSPIDVRLGSLRDNGGTTRTLALLAGSPAIDAGDNSVALTEDQRGYARPVDGDGDAMATTDVGAFEYYSSFTSVAEFLVNTSTGGAQQTSAQSRGSEHAVAMDSAGNYVVVWSDSVSDGSGYGVFAQRYNAAGSAQGSEFQINQTTTDNQYWARVAMADNGKFTVTWTSVNQDGTTSSVYARQFNADGTPVADEFRVNTQNSGGQTNSSIDMDGDGNFIIVWQGSGPSDSDGIFFRRFNADGSAIDAADQLANQSDDGNEQNPVVAMQTDGKFVIAWSEGTDVYFQRFDSSGGTLGSKTKINGKGVFPTSSSDLAIDSDSSGNFTFVCREKTSFVSGIYHRGFSEDGTSQYDYSQIADDDATSPSITMDDAGNYLVTYQKTGDGDGLGVYGRKYDSSGSALDSEFLINEMASGTQHMVSAAMLDIDNFVAVWSGEGSGDSDGVYARQFAAVNIEPIADVSAGEAYEIDEGGSVLLDGSNSSDPDGGSLSYAWDLDNDGSYDDATGETPTVNWATLQSLGIDDDGSYTIGLEVDDGQGGTDTISTTLTINNTAPTLSVTGAATVNVGEEYTLNLSATDPGNDTITGWTINWGDGSIESIAGNPSSVTHTYANTGFTNNILVSATDEDNSTSYIHSDLFAGHYVNDAGIFRVQGSWGAAPTEFATEGTLDKTIQPIIGPDGYLYVSGKSSKNVLRYNASTGAFIDVFTTLSGDAGGIAFGSDGNLYVADYDHGSISRFDGSTGVFIDDFVTGLPHAYGLMFGPDGTLYVNTYNTGDVFRFDGQTGVALDAGAFINTSATYEQMAIGPDGNIYIANSSGNSIERFNGTTGAAMTDFVSAAEPHLDAPNGLAFGPDGNLYVSDSQDGVILCYNGSIGVFIDEYVSGLDKPSLLAFAPDLQVLVQSVNIAPAATNDSYSTGEDTPLTATLGTDDLLQNDTDADGDTLTVNTTPVVDVSHGTLSLNSNGTFTYSPDADWNGTDSFTYEISDGNGGTDTATATITVNPQNDAPVLNPIGNRSVDELTPLNFSVSATDPDLPGDTLTYSLDATSIVAGMTIDAASGAFSWTPTEIQDGLHTVTITVTDNGSGTLADSEIFTITVNDINVAPTVANSIPDQTATEDSPFSYQFAADTFNDVDGDTLSYSSAASGWLTFDAITRIFSGTPTNSDIGTTTVTVTADDGHGGSISDTFDIVVSNTNDAPVITSTAITAATEDTPYSYTFTVSDVDVGDTLTLGAQTLPGWLSFDSATGILSGTPINGDVGDHNVVLRVNDGTVDVEQSFIIVVANVNDAPTAINLDNSSVAENASGAVIGNLTTSDVDSGDSHSYLVDDSRFEVVAGQLKLKVGQSLNHETEPSVAITVTSHDAAGLSISQGFTLTVTDANDNPVVVSDHLNAVEDSSLMLTTATDLLANDTDPDGNLLSLSSFTQPAHGRLVDNGDGTLTYTPDNNFCHTDSFDYVISDGHSGSASGTAFIVVTPVGDTPQVTGISTYTDTLSGLITVTRNAADSSEVGYFKISAISGGTLFLADGVTMVKSGDFISVAEGQDGLRFSPADGVTEGHFQVEASEDGIAVAAQSGTATATIRVVAQPTTPIQEQPLPGNAYQPAERITDDVTEAAEGATDSTETTAPAVEKSVEKNGGSLLPVGVTSGENNGTDRAAIQVGNPFNMFIRQIVAHENTKDFSVSSNPSSPQPLALQLETTPLETLKNTWNALDITPLTSKDYDLVRKSFDAIQDEMTADGKIESAVVSSAIVTSMGLSAGYVFWMLKGGSLLASVLSSMPAWHLADPLSILSGMKQDDDDDESLEDIIQQGADQTAESDEDETDD